MKQYRPAAPENRAKNKAADPEAATSSVYLPTKQSQRHASPEPSLIHKQNTTQPRAAPVAGLSQSPYNSRPAETRSARRSRRKSNQWPSLSGYYTVTGTTGSDHRQREPSPFEYHDRIYLDVAQRRGIKVRDVGRREVGGDGGERGGREGGSRVTCSGPASRNEGGTARCE